MGKIKKILCCASLVKDLLVAMALGNVKEAIKAAESAEADAFIKAADAFAAKLED